MRPPTTSPAGFLGSLRSLGDGVLASVEDRLELFAVELQEEKLRLVQTLIWAGAAAISGMMALAFASLALVYAFREGARPAVLGGLALVYTGVFAAVIIAFRRFIARQPRPLSDTRREIGADRACIRNGN